MLSEIAKRIYMDLKFKYVVSANVYLSLPKAHAETNIQHFSAGRW